MRVELDIGVNEDGQLEVKMNFSDPRFVAQPFKHALSRRQSTSLAAWVVAARAHEDPAFLVSFDAAVAKLVRERDEKQQGQSDDPS
jgi:hypothetical protein